MKGRFLIQVFILASFSILSGKCYSCDEDPTAVILGSDPRYVCSGGTENFNGTSSHDNDEGGASIVGYQWSCPGASVDSPTASSTDITFGNSGSYTVTLTVTDDETATDNETCQVTVIYGHPVNFCSVDCGGPASGYYGARIYYEWGSTTGDNCDLANCEISEEFCDYYEDRPPFYAGDPPNPGPSFSMDQLFPPDVFYDFHGINKFFVTDYEEGVRSYGQFVKWECQICGAYGTLSTVAVGQIVSDYASNPPPSDWRIETRIIPDCPGDECSNLEVLE